MPATTGPNLGLQHSWPLGEFFKDGMDANLKLLDIIVQLSVKDVTLVAPPAAPAEGDRYIVGPAAASGAWAGKENRIAAYVGAAWVFVVPKNGWTATNQLDKKIYEYDGAAWGVASAGGSGGGGGPAEPMTSFHVWRSTAQAINVATMTRIIMDSKSFDVLNEVVADGTFTAQRAGDYVFSITAAETNVVSSNRILVLFVNDVEKCRIFNITSENGSHVLHGTSPVIRLNAGDTVKPYVYFGAANTLYAGQANIAFSGHRVGVAGGSGGGGREVLTADRTYYVSPTGNDANNGLAAGTPFLTIQKAADIICGSIDAGNRQVTVQLADGNYAVGATLRRYVGVLAPLVKGNTATPGNVLIAATAGMCFTAEGANWKVQDMAVSNTAGAGLQALDNGILQFSNLDFRACSSYHMVASIGGTLKAYGNYAVSGGAQVHCFLERQGRAETQGRTVTLTNTPALPLGWVVAKSLSNAHAWGMTFTGAATGPKYEASLNGVIFTNGAGVNYFPGSAAGLVATGGQYA